MQRRASSGRGVAHISPPSSTPNNRAYSNSFHINHRNQNHSHSTNLGLQDIGGMAGLKYRLNQKSFGVANRIWFLLLLALGIFMVTKYIFLSPSAQQHIPFPGTRQPKNYLDNFNYIYPINNKGSTVNTSGFSDEQFQRSNLGSNNPTGDGDSNPFSFCPVFGPGDELAQKYGPVTLSQSRLHLGSGGRIHRFIYKAMSGQPVVISVIGGSVSACHGAGDDLLSPSCYPSMFFSWIQSVFPNAASELTNGAMRRTGEGYFGFCSAHHVPDNVDLVIVEGGGGEDGSTESTLIAFELLIRSLLNRPDNPAVLVLGHFNPQVHQTQGWLGPEHIHSVVTRFYDVPHISTSAALYPLYISSPDSIKEYFADAFLANSNGHRVLTDVLIHYFQTQICLVWSSIGEQIRTAQLGTSGVWGPHEVLPIPVPIMDSSSTGSGSGWWGDEEASSNGAGLGGLFGGVGVRKGGAAPEAGAGGVGAGQADWNIDGDGGDASGRGRKLRPIHPSLRVPNSLIATKGRKGERPFEEPSPFCASANDLVNPVPPSMFYGSGWSSHHPIANPLLTAGHYWYAMLPTSKLRIPIKVGAGDVGLYYLREPIRDVGEGSAVSCWVDDNYSGARTIENAGDVPEPRATLEIIDHFVTRGSHYVECQLLGEEGQGVPSFKIIGVFAT